MTALRYVDGAWLLSADLRADSVNRTANLARHTSAAHQVWGVVSGLNTWIWNSRLWIGQGAAIDRRGRLFVLESTCHLPIPPSGIVVARACGVGPQGEVAIRQGAPATDDVPLSRMVGGKSRESDGDRVWAPRPGPHRFWAGAIGTGAPASGTSSEWTTEFNLGLHLPSIPPTVVAATGTPPDWATQTTVQVELVTATVFQIRVRHHVIDPDLAPTGTIRVTPIPITWVAALPADRNFASWEAL